MNVRIGLASVLATLLIACVFARAAAPLPPAPVNGYCFDTLTTAGYNGVRGCPEAPPPPPPPSGRITTSNIAYVPATGSVRFTAITEWSAIWGHATPFDAETPFPGKANAQPTVLNFTRTGYVAAHFRPSGIGARFGWITHTEYNYGGDLTWAISRIPGDFSPADPLCHGTTLSGQPIAMWTTAPATYRGKCAVAPSIDYYLNIKLTNPAQGTSTCLANSPQCVIGTANSFGG
jgi:hypothetical protein